MDAFGMKMFAAAFALLPIIGGALGVAHVFSSYISSVARNPSVKDDLFNITMMGAAMVELGILLSFLISIMIFLK